MDIDKIYDDNEERNRYIDFAIFTTGVHQA